MARISGVYCIKNKRNNKRYIGCSCDINTRFTTHKYMLKTHKHANAHLQGAYDKYGADSFEFSIIELCPISIMQEREEYWIAYYDSKNNGYNMCDGGGKLTNPTSDVRKKISQGLSGKNNGWYGISRRGELNYMYGKHHTEESKKAMSEKAKQRTGEKANHSKRVMASTGEKFCNCIQASQWVGLKSSSSITQACQGITKTAGRHPVTRERISWKYY